MTMQPQHNHLTRPIHKEPPAHAPNAALMIDFDNVTMAIRSDLQTELKRLLQSEIIRGKVAVQRAYADWRRYPQYIVPLSESSIDLIFAPAHGANKKNATDIRLAIDALELVFTRPEIGTFILLSGDSDFSSLVLKLKEYGKYVIGVGIRESSSDLLIQNCDEYYSYNELAGFTKASDQEYVKRDPWELVVEAVKQMTAHNDVMRSDRLKQVMQEIDPNFDEKDAGYSRFSKFVIEAARRGLIVLTRLDNGQYEIALGPQVEGALAQPSLTAIAEASERTASEPPRGRGGRGRGRGPRRDREETPPPAPTEEAPAAKTAASGFSLGDMFGSIKRAVGMDEQPETETAPAEDDTPRPVFEAPAPPPAAQTPEAEEEDDIPMPASSAPPPPYSTTSGAGGIPMRSARFRRGSRGGARPAAGGAPEIPKIGVVEVDPNFKPRGDVMPPRPQIPAPQSGSSDERGERSERAPRNERGGRGGRGRGGRERGRENGAGGAGGGGERGERGDRPRGRRGGRGRGRGPRRFEESNETTNHNPQPVMESSRSEAPEPLPPPPTPPKATEPESTESFWSRVKRGLTGGNA